MRQPNLPDSPRMSSYRLTLQHLSPYLQLIRMDKPIGVLLLLWPTLWGLWLATNGRPAPGVLAIFVAGTILMRSAGCAINDYADRHFDRHVERTARRPLAAGTIAPKTALWIAAGCALLAFCLILPLNSLTKELSFLAVLLAGSYPYFKRFFAIPQAYLGIAFGFGIPMAYAATQNAVPAQAWWLLAGNIFWAIAYDTEYAMVDREDDLKIGIRTSAITFGRYDVWATMTCYVMALAIFTLTGLASGLGAYFISGMLVASGFAVYHYFLIRTRQRDGCFKAFLNNNWLGASIFAGIALDLFMR
jgi:4-hydroxybenzoate polyprenyltransferase